MERPKRWQLFLICVVGLLTLYNILPTLFYYSQPLRKSIGEKEAAKVATKIASRVNSLEAFSVSWIKAQSKNLGLKPKNITLDAADPKVATVSFSTPKEANLFRSTLERAGSLIPFVPAQLAPAASATNDATVIVQRRVGVHFDPADIKKSFIFVPKRTPSGTISSEYRALIAERASKLALGFGGESRQAKALETIAHDPNGELTDELVIRLSREIVAYETTFGEKSPISMRYFASYTQSASKKASSITAFLSKLETTAKSLEQRFSSLEQERARLADEGGFLDSAKTQELDVLKSQKTTVEEAVHVVKRNQNQFEAGRSPLSNAAIQKELIDSESKWQTVEIGENNPFVEALLIDWDQETIDIRLHPEVAIIRENPLATEAASVKYERLNNLLFADIAGVARLADESIIPDAAHFMVRLTDLTNSSSLLALDFGAIASMEVDNLLGLIDKRWTRSSVDLKKERYPVVDAKEYQTLSDADKQFSLLVYAPVIEKKPKANFRPSSIYVIGKGLAVISEKMDKLPKGNAEKELFEKDFTALNELMRQNGFIGYLGGASNLGAQYQNDVIFELDDYYAYLLAATRENFVVKGDKRQALLEFTDVEQRILAENKIETAIHEDLVKWKDLYQGAKVSLDKTEKYDIPRPTQNVLASNLALSFRKYFRGDNRKILKWGLDLSGGKTVRIGLKGQDGKAITDENDVKQAVGELYTRVNKLGLSEVGIRTEGSSIVLDFPGSQGLTANELVEASAMYFHVVNEKFTSHNATLAEAVNTFLEEVWSEAVITNRTDASSLNEIAWQHLGGDATQPGEFHPKTSHATLLYENGLRFASSKEMGASSRFDDTLSSIARIRGADYTKWYGQTYPLLIVFKNYALEGANLTDVQAGYDPNEGNVLYFGVKSSYITREGEKINPRNDFFAWTSQFSEEKIGGTPNEAFSQGRGWRMAVVLNGSIINAPTLNSALRDSARISGNFSQREINQLAADLKAGSLSFTPHILSEQNISPDLGKEQRFQGISAALFGLFLVLCLMCAVYRFSGLIAACAVLFNLLIMWAVLQNLDAALTLPGIAGIILTVGMAVDANVLIFERIREEFSISGRLPSAIGAGYRKAFSAIIDSNLTTLLAAIILLNFDSGPIKGFALTLMIGIISSLFTSLFMTRFFFSSWVQNPKHKELKMAQLFKKTHFDFLKRAKTAIIASLAVIILGSFFLISQHKTIFGMDFTGGYSLSVNLEEKEDSNYRLEAQKALIAAGAAPSDFAIRELNRPNQLLIQLSVSMQQPGKPFFNLDEASIPADSLYPFLAYPRIVWIVDALELGGLKISNAELPTLNLQWNEMSGQLSDSMRNQALFGLGLALLFILIYITFRFEFKFAASATIALAHDLLITLGIIALLHLFFEGIQIDLQTIAALMTIVGYSLNDTIIIFDRVREDVRLQRKLSFREIINHSLNATLSRTIMTSVTTLLVLLALVILGGSAIFNFALVMTLGVAIGTFSSLFIASPMLLFFHKREEMHSLEAKRG